MSIYVGARVFWALKRYAYRPKHEVINETPTVSVCIAARNEMHALAQCLDYVLTNDYEKLEILVLDDSSSDGTSRIIHSYAHAGVRFIPGKELPVGWLGKNHAYKILAEEASGDYVLYLDVDTLLGPKSITQLVEQLLANDKAMVSVLPRREDGQRASALFGTVRYMWEIVRASRNSPPSSSALWLIRRKDLLELDKGLEDYGMSLRPERHIAKQLQGNKNYYYIIGTKELGIRYEKHLASQYATASRLYYPLTGHHPVKAFIALLIIFGIVLPYFVFPIAVFEGDYIVGVMAGFVTIISYVWYLAFTLDTYSSSGVVVRFILWPYVLFQELALLIGSYISYATKTVRWKGRKVHAQPNNRDHLVINE